MGGGLQVYLAGMGAAVRVDRKRLREGERVIGEGCGEWNPMRCAGNPQHPQPTLPSTLRLKGKQDRQRNGHDKSPKKSKIRRKITTRKRIKSTIKIKSRTSCTRQRKAGRPALRRDLAPTPALALSPLPDLTLHLSLSLM